MSIKPMYSQMNVIHIDQPEYKAVLTSKAQPLSFPLIPADKTLIKNMQETLNQLGGVGLAAPQVNQPKQILVIQISEQAASLREKAKPYSMHVMINPSYEPVPNTPKHSDFEACYSVMNKAGKVPRFEEIKLSFYDESGLLHQSTEQGFYARVIQHEIDRFKWDFNH